MTSNITDEALAVDAVPRGAVGRPPIITGLAFGYRHIPVSGEVL